VAEHPEDDAPEDLANSSQDPVDCRQALPLSPEPAIKVQHLVHKVLTYVEYTAVSGDFQNIDPHPSPPSERVLPQHQRQGGTHSPGGEGMGGQYFGRRQTLDWPLTV
jgi:hypothetical protein